MASMHMFDGDLHDSARPGAGRRGNAGIMKHMQSLLPLNEDLEEEGGEHERMGLVVRTSQRAPGPAGASVGRAAAG